MRKSIIKTASAQPRSDAQWIDLENIASVEVSSEDKDFPIESALVGERPGWRAAEPGEQTIRLIFDRPRPLHRIRLEFRETDTERTQEFVLRWSPDGGRSLQEIVRQQWNFSRPDATRETEDYAVELSNVTLLELIIEPDKENRKARASLLSLHLA